MFNQVQNLFTLFCDTENTTILQYENSCYSKNAIRVRKEFFEPEILEFWLNNLSVRLQTKQLWD